MRPYLAELSRHRRPRTSAATRTPGCRTRSAGTTSSRPRRRRCSREFAESGLAQHRRRLLRHDARAHPRDRRRACASVAAAPLPSAARPRRALHRPRAARRIRPDTNFLMVGERTNVTGSAKFAQADQGRRLRRRRSRSRSSRCAAAPTSSTSTWTRACSTPKQAMTHVPEPDRDRARDRARPDHDRQLEVVGASRPASSACRARASSTRSA